MIDMAGYFFDFPPPGEASGPRSVMLPLGADIPGSLR
jgi:hypothetical protein